MYYLLLLYINKQGVVSLRSVRRGTPSSMAPHHPDKQYSSMVFFNVPWTTMNINVSHLYYANAIIPSLYHGTFPVYLLFVCKGV